MRGLLWQCSIPKHNQLGQKDYLLILYTPLDKMSSRDVIVLSSTPAFVFLCLNVYEVYEVSVEFRPPPIQMGDMYHSLHFDFCSA